MSIYEIQSVELNHYKYLNHLDKLKDLAEGKDIFPVTVEIDPVNFCNHQCDWCVDPVHGHEVMSTDFVEKLLHELHENHVKGIVYKGGGEPTLHEDLSFFISCAKQLNFEVGIVTNGSRLSNFSQSMIEKTDYIRISIDGPTHESHYKIHKNRDFEEIIAGVKKVIRKRGTSRHPVIGLSFAMDYHTYTLAQTAVSLAEDLSVDYILFRTPFFEEVGRKPTMTPKQAQIVRNHFQSIKEKFGELLLILVDPWISDSDISCLQRLDNLPPRRGSLIQRNANGIEHITGTCLASPLLAIVSADRTLYPCCNLRGLSDWAIGKIDYSNNISFSSLWLGEKRRRVMDRIHRIECIRHCTHPMSRYNEIIHYLQSPQYHSSFV